MDDDADPNPSKPKTSLFLGCFGFPRKRKRSSKIAANRRWFRRSTFLLKQSAGTRTVPLNSAASDKIQHDKLNKSKVKPQAPTPQPQPQPQPQLQPQETRPSLEKKVMVLDNDEGDKNGITSEAARKPRKEIDANKTDAVIGMSIIMVTLVIILIWGRLCAILCTCTWLYVLPTLRKKGPQPSQPGLVLEEPYLNSEEYKKRVLLEGFLHRRNHNHNHHHRATL